MSGAKHGGADLRSRRKRLASKPPRPVPPEARTRATERTLRLRGEIAVRPAALLAAALGLFLTGALVGVAATAWLDLDRLLAGPEILAEAPAAPALDPALATSPPPAIESPNAEPPDAEPPIAEPPIAEPEVANALPEEPVAEREAAEAASGQEPASLADEPPAPTETASLEAAPPAAQPPPMEPEPVEATRPPSAAELAPAPPPEENSGAAPSPESAEIASLSVSRLDERPTAAEPDADSTAATVLATAEAESAEPEPGPAGPIVAAGALDAEPEQPVAAADAPPLPEADPTIHTILQEGVTLSELLPRAVLSRSPPAKPEAPSLLAPPTPTARPQPVTADLPGLGSSGEAAAEPPAIELAALPRETGDLPEAPVAEPPVKTRVLVMPEARPESPERDLAPAAGTTGLPTWQRFAVAAQDGPSNAPMIALVIDDLGLNGPNTRRTVALPAPLTLAFLTYAPNLKRITAAARERGHELLVHLPMEPEDGKEDPGPRALLAGMGEAEITEHLSWGLSRFEAYVGLNNHMGSKFTASAPGMAVVMAEVRRRGLLFLDSVTSPGSVAGATARRLNVPFATRDVFIDNQHDDPGSIRRQLERLEAVAHRQGYAVGIGHPHRATLAVLERWIPEVRKRGVRLMPISAVVRHRIKLAAGGEGQAG